MARDSFIFYRSFYESIKELPEENQLKVYKAISNYALNQEEIELNGISKAIFSLIKPQLDANYKKYENGKQKKSKIEAKEKQSESKTVTNVNENENVNVNVNDNNIASEDKSSTATAKASKHKYGNYKHVLLKDEELQNLQKDYSNWEELIKFLDEYIEMKGYKAKSHYLCIKKWVVDAVKKQGTTKSRKESNFEQREYGDLSYLYANKGE